MELKDLSLSFYQYMCKHIVGTKHHVTTMRLLNTVCDNLSRDDSSVTITSGSFGEGLQMRGSDLDMMYVYQGIEVYDITPIDFDPSKTYFLLITDDTKPGFAMLRLVSSQKSEFLIFCEQFKRENYLSNALLNMYCVNERCPVQHGPCISDKDGQVDLAFCVHSKLWVKPAFRWILRSNFSWPNGNIKQLIINHGVLFVPVGVKGSPHQDLEWRISFSVGEKLLIYTFSHTQLICYALMKILLKNVINTDSKCKDLLCSYHLKSILFWISEELRPSIWTPDNLISCFMRCFRRLIYCVMYSVCPHYFIPENNLFENKIEGLDRKNFINTLCELYSYGWRCILFSEQISHDSVFSCNIQHDHSFLYCDDYRKLLKSQVFPIIQSIGVEHYYFIRAVHQIMLCTSSRLKTIHAYFLSAVCSKLCQTVYLSSTISNKTQYKRNKICLSYLLMNINHDTVSGWLMLASYFYKDNQYEKSLRIIVYALSKCSHQQLFLWTELSITQRLHIKWYLVLNKEMVRSLKFLLVDCVHLKTSQFIPIELLIQLEETGIMIPPVVYGNFLSFLCYYHLNEVHECQNSLRKLHLTIAENYFMGEGKSIKALSYYCLGTAFQLIGDNVSAKQAFAETGKLNSNPYFLRPLKRMSN